MAESVSLLPGQVKILLGNQLNLSIKCIHLNTQSAQNKASDIELYLEQFGFFFDILMLSETWYSDCDEVFHLPMYKMLVMNCNSGRGGGVAIMLKESVPYKLLDDFCVISEDYEVLVIVTSGIIFAVFYRPPSGNLSNFFPFLESLFAFANTNKYNIVCGGDFNINMLADTSSKIEMDTLVKS